MGKQAKARRLKPAEAMAKVRTLRTSAAQAEPGRRSRSAA